METLLARILAQGLQTFFSTFSRLGTELIFEELIFGGLLFGGHFVLESAY